jgi:uncharacterized integral membrane protein
MRAKLITIAILAGLAAIVIIQNVAVVDLSVLFWKLSMSGALLMFLILLVGTILGWLLRGSFRRRKNNSHNKHADVVAG